MINEVIDEILVTEREAESIIDSAKAKAEEKMQQNKLQIDEMYLNAQAQLKQQVEEMIKSAGQEAEKKQNQAMELYQKKSDEIIKKAMSNIDSAVDTVIKAIKE